MAEQKKPADRTAPLVETRLGNAALWVSADSCLPASRGINGRRVAGASFLRGFLRHAQVPEYLGLCPSAADVQLFHRIGAEVGSLAPLRSLSLGQLEKISSVDVLYYPSPGLADECWRRALSRSGHWAICGVTHTTATRRVMQAMFDMRAAPQMGYDAVVCTSRAVQAQVLAQMDLTDHWLAQRFGGRTPERPLLPVIPLGVDTADFAPDPALGARLRHRLGVGAEDILCGVIARLTATEKFDPLPLFIAMAEASRRISRRFHLVLCGTFQTPADEQLFAKAAARLMPQCGYHVLDGADEIARKETLSGADIFLFPIDNVQETFGLAPVEAMAAGLPVIASDWDGLRDTITAETGILIPTEAAVNELSQHLGRRLMMGVDNYHQYISQLSAMTRLDILAMTDALSALGGDKTLRAKLGQAGQIRARQYFDWSAVIPAYQELWAEQSQRLAHARATGQLSAPISPDDLPNSPAPGRYFAQWPSRSGPDLRTLYRGLKPPHQPDPAQMMALRDYRAVKRVFEDPAHITQLYDLLMARGGEGAQIEDLARETALSTQGVRRILLWLMKYGFAEEVFAHDRPVLRVGDL